MYGLLSHTVAMASDIFLIWKLASYSKEPGTSDSFSVMFVSDFLNPFRNRSESLEFYLFLIQTRYFSVREEGKGCYRLHKALELIHIKVMLIINRFRPIKAFWALSSQRPWYYPSLTNLKLLGAFFDKSLNLLCKQLWHLLVQICKDIHKNDKNSLCSELQVIWRMNFLSKPIKKVYHTRRGHFLASKINQLDGNLLRHATKFIALFSAKSLVVRLSNGGENPGKSFRLQRNVHVKLLPQKSHVVECCDISSLPS